MAELRQKNIMRSFAMAMDSPKPEEIRQARLSAGLTQAQAAELVNYSTIGWQKCENGHRKMHPATWELFRLKTLKLPDV